MIKKVTIFEVGIYNVEYVHKYNTIISRRLTDNAETKVERVPYRLMDNNSTREWVDWLNRLEYGRWTK